MIDAKKDLVTALSTIPKDLTSYLPVVYELFMDNSTSVPCISYIETNNSDKLVASGCGISTINFTVKVWAKTVDEITDYALKVDTKLRQIGYKRLSSNEIIINDIIEKVLMYQATGYETY